MSSAPLMTLEQLAIFVAVAEREHLTRAAAALRLTPSAVSSAIKVLEEHYAVPLFHRVGRGLALTAEGRMFLEEARAVLTRARSAELALSGIGTLQRGALSIHASQTVAAYWLPAVLMRFHAQYPGITLHLTIGNSQAVASAVKDGRADIGFVEGRIADAALDVSRVAQDELVLCVHPQHPWATKRKITAQEIIAGGPWVLREAGSGTRAEFETALAAMGADPRQLNVVLTLPSNEAVLSAVIAGPAATVVSRRAAQPFLAQGDIRIAPFRLPARDFSLLRHRERTYGRAAAALAALSMRT